MVVTSNGGHGAAKSMESPVLVSFLGLSNRIKIELYFIIESNQMFLLKLNRIQIKIERLFFIFHTIRFDFGCNRKKNEKFTKQNLTGDMQIFMPL
jgi:hypothetical protein